MGTQRLKVDKKEDKIMFNTLVYNIASALFSYKRCIETNNSYATIWLEKIKSYEKLLPSGSGIDNGCKIDIDNSTENKIIIKTTFHHMDQNDNYTKWTYHTIKVTPSFTGIDVDITNDKDSYLHDVFQNNLNQPIQG